VPASRHVIFWLLAIGGCAADLATKHWVFQWLFQWLWRPKDPVAELEPWWIWTNYVGLQTATNPGALFGMGAGGANWFAGLSVVAMVGILYWLFVRKAAVDGLLTFALGCVTGGILGNLYDRLGLWTATGPDGEQYKDIQEVRDWILLRYGDFTWPNFNIADCLLVCGAAMLFWHAFFVADRPKTDGSDDPS
jgi:signal peptidase II